MAQEEKELLIKDLSARIPYKVKASYYGTDEEMECTDVIEGIIIENNDAEIIIGQYGLSVEKVKPYLFPLSSMNSAQKLEYNFIVNWIYPNTKNLPEGAIVHTNKVSALLHFYNRYYLDYNGLIEKGLAIDATGLNIYWQYDTRR